MITYIVRRTLYAIPILIGVNLIVFFLFFIVNSPDQMARRILGEKNITQEDVNNWKKQNGYHLPLWFNAEASGTASFTETIFFEKSVKLFFFDFGTSDANNIDITSQISQRMWASLAIALPTFLVGVLVNITVSMICGLLPGNLCRFLGHNHRGNPYVRLHTLLYYRWTVGIREDIATLSDLWIRFGCRHAEVRYSAGGYWHYWRGRWGYPFLPDDIP